MTIPTTKKIVASGPVIAATTTTNEIVARRVIESDIDEMTIPMKTANMIARENTVASRATATIQHRTMIMNVTA